MTEYITLALAGAAAVLALVCVLTRPRQGATLRDLQNLSQELQEEMRALRTEVGGTIHGTLQSTAELQANAQWQVAEAQNTRLRELSEQLAANGQIATQYAGLDGYATMDTAFNPNGSVCAIEGITSPDGRVFGKMGHSERIGPALYRNVPGTYDMHLFASAVRYFKK